MNDLRNSSSHAIPWVRVAAIRPVVDYLGHIGVPADRYLARNRLPHHGLTKDQNILPRHVVGRFLSDVALSEGLKNLGWDAVQWLKGSPIEWFYAIPRAPTLYQALKTVTERGMKNTSLQFGIREQPHSVRLYRRQSFNLQEYDQIMASFAVALFLEIARAYIGDGWLPPRMAIPFSPGAEGWVDEQLPEVQIESNERTQWLEIPRRYLSLPLLPPTSTAHEKSRMPSTSRYGRLDADYVGTLVRVLQAYLSSGVPSVKLAADVLGTSPRTLQRRLHECGYTYRQVLGEAQFGLARQMLDTGDFNITEVAHEVGYGSPSNFTRAFRRLAGVTPTEYQHHRRF